MTQLLGSYCQMLTWKDVCFRTMTLNIANLELNTIQSQKLREQKQSEFVSNSVQKLNHPIDNLEATKSEKWLK